jgi:pimeloyl-ACP methyl ester carboxylesterase
LISIHESWQDAVVVRSARIGSEHGPELELRVAGDVPSVLLVHGACCHAIVWDSLMLGLLDLGIASAALSLRGHGGSKGTEHLQQYRIEHYVEDVLQTLPSLVRPVTLVGHSMGGLVCQLAAAKASLRRLILMAPCPIRGMREDGVRMARRHPYTFLTAFLRRSFLRLYRNPRVRRSLLYHAGTPETVISRAANTLVEESWQAGNQMNAILPDPTQVRCPVTVLGAAEDFMVSPASIQATALAYKVEPVFLSASGHMIQSEIPPPKLAALFHSLLTR